MKKFLNLLLATPVAAVIMVACQSDEGITYSGPEYKGGETMRVKVRSV